jgi:hypothetical protein
MRRRVHSRQGFEQRVWANGHRNTPDPATPFFGPKGVIDQPPHRGRIRTVKSADHQHRIPLEQGGLIAKTGEIGVGQPTLQGVGIGQNQSQLGVHRRPGVHFFILARLTAILYFQRPNSQRYAVHHHQAADTTAGTASDKSLPHRLFDFFVILLPGTALFRGRFEQHQIIGRDTASHHVIAGQFEAVSGFNIGDHQNLVGFERPADSGRKNKPRQDEKHGYRIITGADVHDGLPSGEKFFLNFTRIEEANGERISRKKPRERRSELHKILFTIRSFAVFDFFETFND